MKTRYRYAIALVVAIIATVTLTVVPAIATDYGSINMADDVEQVMTVDAVVLESCEIQQEISTPSAYVYAQTQPVQFDSITINGSEISVSGTYGGSLITFTGEIYISSLTSSENTTFVCALTDDSGEFEPQYCEITTTDTADALMNDNLNDCKMFKLYFTDKCGTLTMIECELDEVSIAGLSTIEAIEDPEATIDTAWFTKVIEPDEVSERSLDSFSEEEIANDNGLKEIVASVGSVARASNSYSWTSSVYSQSYTVGTEKFKYSACAYFYGNIGDVPDDGTTEWVNTLELVESVTVDNVLANQYTSIYYIDDIAFSIGCGSDTEMIKYSVEGSYVKRVGGTINTNISAMAAKLINSVTGTTTASTVLGWINTVSVTSAHTETVQTGTYALEAGTRAISIEFDSNVMLNDAEHQLIVSPIAETMEKATTSNVNAPCIIRWTFNLSDSSDGDGDGDDLVKSFTGTSAQKTVYFTANAS